MTVRPSTRTLRSIRRHLYAGAGLFLLLVGGVGSWAATTEISGAVIAPGALVVDSSVKKVQHPTGGIVAELNVRDGDRVKSGDVLVRLDDTVTRAGLAIVTKGLDELLARKARLEAERDGQDDLNFPNELVARASDPGVARVMQGERKLFEIRRSARMGQKAQLHQRIDQLDEQTNGLTIQEQAKAQEIVLINRELQGAHDLWAKNLMPITKLTALEREATRVEGERGQLIAAVAQSKDRRSETELQITQIDRDLASEVGKDLREVEGKIGELVERKVTAEDQLKRIDIRAPQDGTVHQLAVHTVGGVIGTNGETIMLIVPKGDNLAVEAKVLPQDIDQLRLSQQATLRFSAFNQRTTPEINGEVSRISADVSVDQRTGQSYYTTRITLPAEEIARLGNVKLVPGMPVEAFIETGDRNVLSYLVKPMRDQVERAFREK
ncbi:MAG: HlyD family type I secretion periplasmic adaptor subunit [Hyphomicrobiaceae bacterium]